MTAVFDEQKLINLPINAQQLLEFISILYAPIAATPLSKLSPVAMDVKVLRPLLDDLVRLGLLTVTSNNYYACAAGIRDELTRRSLRTGRFTALAKVVETLTPTQTISWTTKYWTDADQALRDLRLQALLGNGRQLATLLERANQQYANSPKFQPHPWLTLWGSELDEAWMAFFPAAIFLQFIAPIYLSVADKTTQDASRIWQHCQQLLKSEQMDTSALWTVFGGTYYWQLFQRLQWDDALALEPPAETGIRLEYWHLFASARALSQGKQAEAMALYQAGLKLLRKRQGSRKALYGTPLETLYVIALILDGTDKSLKEAAAYFKEFMAHNAGYGALYHFQTSRQTGKVQQLADVASLYQQSPLTFLIALMVRHWLGQALPADWLDDAAKIYQKIDGIGYVWLTDEYAAVLAQLLPDKDKRKPMYVALSTAAHTKAGTQPLISLYQPQAEWERGLQALQRLGAATPSKSATTAKVGTERVIWELTKQKYASSTQYGIYPTLQKATKTGWSGGRNIALKRLATEPDTVPALTVEDRSICQGIRLYSYGYYEKSYELHVEHVWQHLIGHPRVFWAGATNSPLDIQPGREELQILKEKGKLRIKLFPELPADGEYKPDSYFVVEETTLQLKLYKLTASVLQLHGILGKDGLLVPAEAEATVRQTLSALAPLITIQSDIAGMDNAETVPRRHASAYPPATVGRRFADADACATLR